MGLVLSLNEESIVALRNWADEIIITADSIRDDTEKLISELNSNKESLGIHENSFLRLILHMQKFQVIASESIEALPKMMNATADRIEIYLYGSTDQEDSEAGWQRTRR